MPQQERDPHAIDGKYAGLSEKQVEVLRRNAFKAGNPGPTTGNRWTAAQRRFRELLFQEVPEDPEGRRRFDMLVLAAYDSSLLPGPKGALDRRLIVEQICGKPRDNPGDLDFAEHFRQVESDRIRTVVAVLGPKLREMGPTQLAEFFRQCANDPAKFLTQAGQVMSELTGQGESPAEPSEAVGANSSGKASPKGCDTASHAPDDPIALDSPGSEPQPELPAEKPGGEP